MCVHEVVQESLRLLLCSARIQTLSRRQCLTGIENADRRKRIPTTRAAGSAQVTQHSYTSVAQALDPGTRLGMTAGPRKDVLYTSHAELRSDRQNRRYAPMAAYDKTGRSMLSSSTYGSFFKDPSAAPSNLRYFSQAYAPHAVKDTSACSCCTASPGIPSPTGTFLSHICCLTAVSQGPLEFPDPLR